MSDAKAMRPVLLHAHLFKNAGTTLDWSLARSFSTGFCDHRDDASMRGNPQYLAEYLMDNQQIRALSSHWMPFPLPELDSVQLRPLVILRHPIERILSVYEFERRQAVDHPGTQKARDGDLQSYVRWRLEESTGPVIRNYQTRMLSGIYPGTGDSHQFECAAQLLEALPAFGIVERYRESAVLFEQALKSDFTEIDLSFQRQNVRDASDRRSPEERRASVEQELGELLEPVRSANSLDLALYELACERFDSDWQNLANAEALLHELDARCQQLGAP
ncbi:hypothetical protein [Congregibacter sp.]|uniref:hypothetical protein n=1 Tax=Congregibacter sp. TaxID=2744308 RepID=UPI003F6C6093